MEIDFPKLERKVLNFWKKNSIFERSIEKRKGSPNFVFYEGPPTANAPPGLHHVLARVFKDIICRYKTMRGFLVLRKAGWDTHGLPVELQVEKKLNFKTKKDIEKFGIEKFNFLCKKSVLKYKKDWERLTERIGFWIDLKNPYITFQKEYIESLWFILKKIWEKGLLYKDLKVSPYCPRCQTVLSSHEVALGYKKIKEPAIYVKFKILNSKFKDNFLLVWTTTPWTLPANVAVALNPNFVYAKIKFKKDFLILAKERIKACQIEGEIVQEFKGKDLENLKYEPVYPFNEKISNSAYKTILADFVSLKEGTGLVHIAPAFGQEDLEIGKKYNLPILITVDEEGKFKKDIKKFSGLFVKEADPLIIQDLKERNLLFKEEIYEHDYPFCWRCHSPLLYYAKESWFIRMKKLKEDLIKNNQKINWIPAHLKEGRFGEWLKEVKDWALSRERYWGTPLPAFKCKGCGSIEFIGSLKDLLKQKFSKNEYFIFRHGHSLRQVKKLSSCFPEKFYCPLTEEGKKEVLNSAKKLKRKKIDLIFSSDLLRTKQSAKILKKELKAKLIFEKSLREWNVGIFNGKPSALAWDYLKKFKNWLSKKLPKGESLIDVRKRMYRFLEKIEKKYQGKKILIVSHELPLTILEWTLKGKDLNEILELRKRKKIKVIETGKFKKIEFKKLPFNQKMELDFHRPYVDEIKFFCKKCGGLMEREKEVIDCWFDSGAMPFAQFHWPFENQKFKPKLFPADYISEGIDQTRGWFYTLLAVSTLLGFGPPFKNVISLGHVLDEKGEKMSKSKGNVVEPWYIVEKYGADSTRWYFYTINQPGDSKLFSEKDVAQVLRKFILTLWNCFQFYKTYAISDSLQSQKIGLENLLDKWIVSRLNQLILRVTNALDKYDVTGAARFLEDFVIKDLSLWYIRRARPRFQRPKNKRELKEASKVLGFVLLTLSKLTAPFIPFLSEKIYQEIKKNSKIKSVHLEDWPKANQKLIDQKLEEKMEKVREIVAKALAQRAKAKIKIRQPLSQLQITNFNLKKEKELLELIKEEVNVKKITFGKEFKLDTKITPELKKEGIIREIMRQIQEMRKEANLKPKDQILVNYFGSLELNNLLEKSKSFILKEGKIKNLKKGKSKSFDLKKEIEIDGQKLWLAIKKLK